ncbi:regulatory protein RecX [Terrabacter sp. NPDC080008]|uniref:regulatory protein RecX n=1 Tax=Terrabacter sp. NPDC080008 TaxID=3155176 RepID=UPI0034502D6D
MGSSDQETSQDRLARAAAALADAEVVARARASGLPPATGTALGAAQRPAAGRRAAGRARSRPSPAKAPGTGWGSQDPGERPDWAPPPEESDLPTPGADAVREDGAAPEPDELSDGEAESVARAIVLRQLSMAPRSRSQLEKKLRQRGCDDDVAAKVLDRFTEVGLVDDEAYAQMLVRSKQSGNGLARKALAHELRKQGIDQEIADEALGQVGAGDERARAELLVEKKLRTMRGLDPAVQARRLAGMLARKGYSGEVAWPVIRDALDGLPEHRRD